MVVRWEDQEEELGITLPDDARLLDGVVRDLEGRIQAAIKRLDVAWEAELREVVRRGPGGAPASSAIRSRLLAQKGLQDTLAQVCGVIRDVLEQANTKVVHDD